MSRMEFDTSALQSRKVDFDSSDDDGSGNDSNDSGASSASAGISTEVSTIAGGRRSVRLSNNLRQTVIILFVYLAVLVPLIIYISTRRIEVESFENEFEALGSKVVESFGLKFSRMLSAVDSLSISATSYVLDTNGSWPFVTMLDFDLRGASVLSLSETAYVAFHPVVSTETRADWEDYSQENIWWIEEALEREGKQETSRLLSDQRKLETPDFSSGYSKQIFAFDNETGATVVDESPGPYYPTWQMVPINPLAVNLNTATDKEAVEAMIESREAVIGDLRNLDGDNPVTDQFQMDFYSSLLQNFHNDPNITYDGEPVSTFHYPAFDTFESDRKVVGVFSSIIFWQTLFIGILPPNSLGIVCFVENSCGAEFTFDIDGSGATYLGPGDLHDEDYGYLERVFRFEEIGDRTKFKFSDTAAPLNEEFCPYNLHVYPSDQLQQQHITAEPMWYASGVVLVFLVVALISMTYDCVVQRRMRVILKTAEENRALVASLFPEAFRNRLFLDQEESAGPVFTMGAPSKMRLKAMLGAKNNETMKDQDLSFLAAKPIADLFPHCTVIFADISGFSAWSSERAPEQIFTLLETIFQTFDKIARRRSVFKVETIGDSYVAVTGLPDQQMDHAVRMARFARDCMTKVNSLTKTLEASLGPDTGELKMRFGLHSGQVTAGILRGEKSRFQLFGDTVNTASRMESTGIKNRIQLSHTTAQLIIEAGKEAWIVPREDTVKAKGKGVVQTYWMVHQGARDNTSVQSNMSFISETTANSTDLSFEDPGALFSSEPKEGLWGEKQGVFTLPPSSQAAKRQRLVNWLTDIIACDLRRLVALRIAQKRKSRIHKKPNVANTVEKGDMPLSEVVEAFTMPKFDPKAILNPEDSNAIELPDEVMDQLRDFVSRISRWYRNQNPFHNFEHASHVTMSSMKLLSRIVSPEAINYTHQNAAAIAEDLHSHTFGIASDPLAQFAVTMAALVHDVDHTGVPNLQAAKENPELGKRYKQQSVLEQNSVDIAWDLLMEPKYKTLQGFIFTNETELKRFRQYIVNLVCATDIFNKDMKELRNQRWDKAFIMFEYDSPNLVQTEQSVVSSSFGNEEDGANESANLKATIVLEHIIQAADVSHTMQHWNVYRKWNERLFQEMFAAFDNDRGGNDPTEGWYKGELWFFDNYIIPLAQKLEECGVFGVSSDECLNYALENRKEWALKGKAIVEEFAERYQKRKMLEVDGFTTDEIENFTSDDLDYILRRLIKKGRSFATFKGHDREGQMNAAKAWFHAFELYERSHVSNKLPDESLIFAIYSGVMVFVKGGMIIQDDEQSFEQNLAETFCQNAKSSLDPIHYARALAVYCEVLGRLGRYEEALATFDTLANTYIIEEHSHVFVKVYGTDRAAQMYSQRAYWYYGLGKLDDAAKCCEDVIQKILPWMETKNVLNTFELLLPVLRIHKTSGRAKLASDLFEENVMKQFREQAKKVTMCRPVLTPLSMLLRVCGDLNGIMDIGGILEWLLIEGNGESDDFLDNLYSKLGWAPNSITAELCLVVAKRVRNDSQAKILVQKGVFLARKVERKLSGGNGVIMAYEIHKSVMEDINAMAESLGVLSEVEHPSLEAVTTGPPLKTSLGEIRLINQ